MASDRNTLELWYILNLLITSIASVLNIQTNKQTNKCCISVTNTFENSHKTINTVSALIAINECGPYHALHSRIRVASETFGKQFIFQVNEENQSIKMKVQSG